MNNPSIYTLANGIRVVHQEVNTTRLVHCGFVLNIGSRDETGDEQGLAHFWEHMAFKGTRKRKSFHIINRLESVGGELNAYTTKEKICFYASILGQHADKAVELLSDITFDSIFPEKQIEREKHVILEEIAMYKDDPEDDIQDEFDHVVFQNHPLAHNILGTDRLIRSYHREDFKKFIAKNLNTHQVVFTILGNISTQRVQKLVEKHIKPLPAQVKNQARLPFENYSPTRRKVSKPIHQVYVASGRPAMSTQDKNRIPFFMLANILGGPGLNSRLNLAIRERYGYVYSVDAHYSSLSDTGLFSILFATDPSKLDRTLQLINRELVRLQQTPLGRIQLQSAKDQLKGQLAIAHEHYAGLMLSNGKNLLDLGKVLSLQEEYGEIDRVTADKLIFLSRKYLDINQFSNLIYHPE